MLNIKLHTWQVLPNNDNIKFVSIKFSGLVGEESETSSYITYTLLKISMWSIKQTEMRSVLLEGRGYSLEKKTCWKSGGYD